MQWPAPFPGPDLLIRTLRRRQRPLFRQVDHAVQFRIRLLQPPQRQPRQFLRGHDPGPEQCRQLRHPQPRQVRLLHRPLDSRGRLPSESIRDRRRHRVRPWTKDQRLRPVGRDRVLADDVEAFPQAPRRSSHLLHLRRRKPQPKPLQRRTVIWPVGPFSPKLTAHDNRNRQQRRKPTQPSRSDAIPHARVWEARLNSSKASSGGKTEDLLHHPVNRRFTAQPHLHLKARPDRLHRGPGGTRLQGSLLYPKPTGEARPTPSIYIRMSHLRHPIANDTHPATHPSPPRHPPRFTSGCPICDIPL